MAEDRAKDTQVEAPSVTCASDRLWIQLVGGTDARRDSLPRRVPSHVGAEPAGSGDLQVARRQVHDCTITPAIDRLREINLIPDPQVQRQGRGYAPSVLRIEEGPLLELLRVRGGAGISLKGGYLPQHEGCKAQAA